MLRREEKQLFLRRNTLLDPWLSLDLIKGKSFLWIHIEQSFDDLNSLDGEERWDLKESLPDFLVEETSLLLFEG